MEEMGLMDGLIKQLWHSREEVLLQRATVFTFNIHTETNVIWFLLHWDSMFLISRMSGTGRTTGFSLMYREPTCSSMVGREGG
jgi:hypothetical protein